MRDLAHRLLAIPRKGWFQSRPLFEPYAPFAESDLRQLEERLGQVLPLELKSWLTMVGYGDIDQSLSFRAEWIEVVETGQFKGAIRFAQDELGNFYAFTPSSERIVFFSRTQPAYAVIAPSLEAFLSELEKREFKILNWVETLELMPYA